MRLGVSRLARSLDGYVEWARYVDRAGFALLGFGDSQNRWADSTTLLAITAVNTSRVTIGPFVANPITRHPAVAANAMTTLQQLSGGRAFFGLGAGESSIRDVGARPLPLPEFEEYARAVKGLCAGESVDYRGRSLRMLWPVEPVPLWIAGDGPRIQRLAGRIADAAIVGNGASPELVRHALAQIRAGAEEAGRDPSRIEVWWMTRVLVAPTEAAGFEQLRFYLATYANTRYRTAASEKGLAVPPDIRERLDGMRREFRYDETLRPDLTFNAGLVDRYGLREWLGRQFAVTGPPDQCVERLRELEAAGARNLVVPQVLPDVMVTTRELAETILPAFL